MVLTDFYTDYDDYFEQIFLPNGMRLTGFSELGFNKEKEIEK